MSDPLDLKLNASEPIIDEKGCPTLKFQRKWQEIVKKLEEYEARIAALEP